MFLKVDVLFDRVRWESRSIQHDELEVVGKLVLRHPGRVTVPDAPMNEDQALHGTQPNATRLAQQTFTVRSRTLARASVLSPTAGPTPGRC
jgi:hypothetical protein